MCIPAALTSPKSLINSAIISSMHSSKQNSSVDEQQEFSSDIDNVKIGVRANTPSSITGNRSDIDSPIRSYALIETDPNELDRIIDVLRQFFPNTRIVECNNVSSNPSRTPSRSSLATAPQQTSIESNSSLRVPTSLTNRYALQNRSLSEKSSFDSDILQIAAISTSDNLNSYPNDLSSSNSNSQAFKGKVKDYLQRRYLEQINEHQARKETFLKCRSDESNYDCIKSEPSSTLIQSCEHIPNQDNNYHLEHHHHHYHHNRHHTLLNSSSTSSTIHKSNTTVKARSFDSSTALLQHSVSDTNLCCSVSASDTKFIQSQTGNIIRSQSKRGLLQRCETIDMEDAPTTNVDDEHMKSLPASPIAIEKLDAGKITFSIDRPDDDDDDDDDDDNDDDVNSNNHNHHHTRSQAIPPIIRREENARRFRHSYSEQKATDESNSLFVPFRHSFEQQNGKRPYSTGLTTMSCTNNVPLPVAPYSASSDPGPYLSPWSHTPTNPYSLVNFHFPKSQENTVANAQGSIAQLSTLTQFLCDEPSVFTPISPRFKTEAQDSNNIQNPSSVPPCQICRQQFESRQTYLAHYRSHLENSGEDDKSGIIDFNLLDTNGTRSGEPRNYSCKICSKRFSRSDMLNRHLRLHSGIRPYRCTMCNTHFSRSDHLSTHLRTHTGEKPYACPECSYAACRRDMITRHLKVHLKQRPERKNATSSLGSGNES
ncbi:unnamed protein product [Rotaria magnacalcarata]|uniref:C2H2-type domain-containing protein n=1 Tax=Rotaria magnacalcarata TaxID=392030 RepID=A0A819H324_9BILA|nr:unnamed protein product [Rotaria magnacalcarata]CAF3895344.1 unnamed protein product [Rotaria magnacalcarata]